MTGPLLTWEADAVWAVGRDGRPPWTDWPVPECEVSGEHEPWGWDRDAFWRQPAAGPVDWDRTRGLDRWDQPVVTAAGRVWAGCADGFPVQIIPADTPRTTVIDSSVPWWPPWTFEARQPKIPLPPLVRCEGDPAGGSDRHWRGIVPGRELWEVWVMRRTLWWLACSGHARWRLDRPWNAAGQPRGVVAAQVPHTPMIVRWDEVEAGRIGHRLFASIGAYSPERVGPARGSDGFVPGHPVRAGELLRLRADAWQRFASLPERTPARVVAKAMREFGVMVGDRNTDDPSGRTGHLACAFTMDRRWAAGAGGLPGLGDMGLRLTDFEVVAQ